MQGYTVMCISFEIIYKSEISSDIKILFEPFTKQQLENLYGYIPLNTKAGYNISEAVKNISL